MTIVLHIGLPKTGSSALQYGFERNAAALKAAGVHYALGRVSTQEASAGITSGNGSPLVRYLVPAKRGGKFDVDTFPKQFNRTYVDRNCHTTLISSEALAFADGDMLRRFVDEVVRGRPLVVVAFVRDLYGHSRSSWMQGVKRAALVRTFARHAHRVEQAPQIVQLRTFAAAIGVESMRVLHYETERSDLFGALARAAGLTLPDLDTRLPTINRSLSGVEVEVLRNCNLAHRDPAFARLVSDRLIERYPGRPSFSEVDDEVVRLFEERYAGDVAWVNDTFFGGSPTLRTGATAHASVREELAQEDVWREVVGILVDEVRAARGDPPPDLTPGKPAKTA